MKDCYFINGTAYAGKSTMCKLLAEKYDLILCGENYGLDRMLEMCIRDRVSVLPMYFAGIGRSSSASGILNSSAYLGSALSTYGIGAAASALGWDVTITGWCICGALGAAACLAGLPNWLGFSGHSQKCKKLEV